MVEIKHEILGETESIDRLLGSYTKGKEGPTVIFLCGTHGNETSSVFAMKKIFRYLEVKRPQIKGELVAAFSGNLKALELGVRYVDADLNRGWVPERLKKLGFLTEEDKVKGHEKKEQKELIRILQNVIAKAKGEVFVFDLHTTSAPSAPFTAVSDTIRNRKLALKFPLPCVVGFDEITEGTFMNYVNEMGIPGVAFEAGEHFSLDSLENNISFIWHTLKVLGCMKRRHIPNYKRHLKNLSLDSSGKSKIYDLTYHHKIKAEDEFKMKEGYGNFDEIEKGEILAFDKNGPVHAQESGNIFMPLYQKQGADGYFIVQEKSKKWLKLTERLRKKRDDEMLTAIPGVKVHPEDNHTLIVDSQLFGDIRDRLHMLGFRRYMQKDDKIITTRRVYDVNAPSLKSMLKK